MDFRILGPLEVVDGERALALGGIKQRSLLAVLLQHPNEIVSADRIQIELWGDATPPAAANSIHVYVSHLRKALGAGRLVTRPPGYALRVEPGELDLDTFERLRASARPHDALALWRGPPSPTSSTSRACRPSARVWRSCGSPRWRSASTLTWPPGGRPTSCPSWRRWSHASRCARGLAARRSAARAALRGLPHRA